MEQKVNCPSCGWENNAGQQFCGRCGVKLGAEAQPERVVCPSCGSENDVGKQFCGACGGNLAGEAPQQSVACPGCGLENPAGQQFCGACGTQLAGEREPQVVSERQPEVVSERRQNVVRVVEPVASPGQTQIRPTWGLAWGLYWRMALLSLLIGGTSYLIFAIVLLALGFQLGAPFGF